MPYTPTDWVNDETPLSAANLDHLETGVDEAHAAIDAIVAASGVYQAYTPTLTAATSNPNLGSTHVIAGRWTRHGDTIHCYGALVFAGSGIDPGSGRYRLSLPVTARVFTELVDYSLVAGSIEVWDNTFLYHCTAFPAGGGAYVEFNNFGTSEGAVGGSLTHDTPFTWGSGASLWWNFSYEAA